MLKVMLKILHQHLPWLMKAQLSTSNEGVDSGSMKKNAETSHDQLGLFNLANEYPTDRGHFPSSIEEGDLKRLILSHGPCKPDGPFTVEDEQASAVYLRWKEGKTISDESQKQNQRETNLWVNVLRKVLGVILCPASLSLTLRGHDEKYATQYISPKIQNELILTTSQLLRKSLVTEINECPFSSIVLDTTSDINRVDQLSVTARWVKVQNENVTIKETFLGFISVTDGTAAGLVETTCKYVEDIGLDMEKLRGQAYDGASVMSGVHNGVQKLIKYRSSKPVPFIHCAAHNLNLVINDAVNSVVDNDNFFGVIQSIYVFFSSSINRSRDLQLLAVDSSLSLKKLCVTRWSSRVDSVRGVRDRFVDILKRLTVISLTSKDKKERDEAVGIKKNTAKINFIINIVYHKSKIDFIINQLHIKGTAIKKCRPQCRFQILSISLSELRYLRNSWESVRMTANALAASWGIPIEFEKRRERGVKQFFGELASDSRIEDSERAFKINIFYRTIDVAVTQIEVRFKGTQMVAEKFDFLFPRNFVKLEVAEIKLATSNLLRVYGEDFDGDDLEREVRSFQVEFLDELKAEDVTSVSNILEIIYKARIASSFPQLCKLLLLFLTIPVTVASAERSFSKLKIIKSYLRSSMAQERLDGLTLISIENKEITQTLKDKVINHFAFVNARRKDRFSR
ncbi:zinc finger MYM-type 1-like [Paramuricea clavata]|uniref:Zinc finger MYM-type 1-like n=1 Tax=Paramuricea clavata TaxID=317549 RepID=A0A6S7IX96_PARCT|nr:zinc finger MYM-type 1-like [Paramuricea clavata]